VVSYSLPFEGVVSRDELDRHLHTNPKVPDAIPFKFKYYERDWGLCCSQHTRDSLTDDAYRVVIRTSFSYSTLKVGEVVAPGEHAESIVLCAHLCHPAMVNDDLSGVVVGIEVMRQLLQRTHRRYTYRLLILPETIGSVAFLSHHEDLIPSIKGGLFLEMLGLDHPHALQLSFHGDTELDRCFRLAVQEGDDAGWVGAFRTIIGNDERQFNAPGVRIPMLSLSRSLPRTHPDWPYREYHTSHDTPACTHTARLEESCALVLRMVDILEANQTPINAFKGEVFLSRYGMHLDFQDDPMGNQRLFDVLYMLDGTHTMAEIAEACGVYFATVQEIVYQFHRHNLVQFRPSESASSNRCEGHSPGS
jgi:aminopeptidase-like protein